MSRIPDTKTAFAVTQYRREALKSGVRALSDRMRSPRDSEHCLCKSTHSGLGHVRRALGAHPLPCAMVGIGLAWLVTSSIWSMEEEPPTAEALSDWDSESEALLEPDEYEARIHKTSQANSVLPMMALGLGALSISALMSDGLRRSDPVQGNAAQSLTVRLIGDEVTDALQETELALNRLIGRVGRQLIDRAQSAVDRFLADAGRTVDKISRS